MIVCDYRDWREGKYSAARELDRLSDLKPFA